MNQMIEPHIWRDMRLERYVTADVETTGLDAAGEEIIEFAGVLWENGQAVQSLQRLIRPTKKISEKIIQITGITNEMVADAPPFAEVLPEIRDFIGTAPIVGHNVMFDMRFLEYHARRTRENFAGWGGGEMQYHYFPNPVIDTVMLARIYLSFADSFSLGPLCRQLGITLDDAHRALPDATATGHLFNYLLTLALGSKFTDVQRILRVIEPVESSVKHFFEMLAIFLSAGKHQPPQDLDQQTLRSTATRYNIIGRRQSVASHERSEKVDVGKVGSFFENGGPLSQKFRLYESRDAQVKMARAVADALNNGQLLVAEAGTGTGKSLAYLVPAIKWALENSGNRARVVISTNTKNLQEQLFFKDLPILTGIMERSFKAVLLKGKGNYLCLDKWTTVLKEMQFRLAPGEREQLLPLLLWTQQTETGDISENNGFRAERNYGLWSKLIAENNYCPGRACKFYDDCFLMKARNNARDADLVLVNHSLLFSDLATDKAVLGEYTNVIFDEAHNIENTATEYLGADISMWQFRDMFNKLHNKDRGETGVLVHLKRRVSSGSMSEKHLDAVESMLDKLIDRTGTARRNIQTLFNRLSALLGAVVPEDQRQYSSRHRYRRDDNLFEPLNEETMLAEKALKALKDDLTAILNYFEQVPSETFEYQQQLLQELSAQSMQLDLLSNNLQFLMAAQWDTHVYWFELITRRDRQECRLYAAPLDIGAMLNEHLYANINAAIFTSATLAVNGSFEYFKDRTGLNRAPADRVEELLFESPFNYAEQTLLAVPSFLPEPSHPTFQSRMQQLTSGLSRSLNRGTLLLFTSYSMLNTMHRYLKDDLLGTDIPVLAQGKDGSRQVLMNRLRNEAGAMLLGTDSFWEGVDVPGKALELVVITRLPFDVPSDPVFQARSELIRAQGGNPFMDYSIPEAVIRFRQGFGRLIRTRSDYGAVIILDTRVVRKFYGRVFLQSLPAEARLIADEAEFWQVLQQWFERS